jgi:D-alanyl-lipoteichoic acid acyltransferase DltB (MBOAT superfamily)
MDHGPNLSGQSVHGRIVTFIIYNLYNFFKLVEYRVLDNLDVFIMEKSAQPLHKLIIILFSDSFLYIVPIHEGSSINKL